MAWSGECKYRAIFDGSFPTNFAKTMEVTMLRELINISVFSVIWHSGLWCGMLRELGQE